MRSPARPISARLESDLLKEISGAADLAALDAVRVAALGKKGRVSELMSKLGALPAEERKAFGQAVNGVKEKVSAALDARKGALESAALSARLATERADVTLPVRAGPEALGRIHPVSQVFDECVEIFADMGFEVAEGPDIETDEMNFGKLNIPGRASGAPGARHVLFRAEDRRLAAASAHAYESRCRSARCRRKKPPIRIIAPGRVYRCDSDQTHTPMFHQIEGLVIDETTHMGHLKWVLEEFCKAFFEVDEVKMRFRASHFPFTEP